MSYLISFLEGIITFISPCLLPMLPIYITYFAGGGGFILSCYITIEKPPANRQAVACFSR